METTYSKTTSQDELSNCNYEGNSKPSISEGGAEFGQSGADRGEFWRFCLRAAASAKVRAKRRGVQCTIRPNDIDRLLVDQGWCCAVSGIQLENPGGPRNPFGPSLDRIIPALGYIHGNIRVVCNMVNMAMAEWDEGALLALVRAIRDHRGDV